MDVSVLMMYLIAGLELFFLPYLAVRLWRIPFQSVGGWLLEASVTLLALAMLYVIGRWDVVGLPLRSVVCGGSTLGALLSGVRVAGRPFTTDTGIRWRWGAVVESAFFAGVLMWSLMGMGTERSPVALAAPLRGGTYYVVQGGATPPLNYHGLFSESQRFALDINRLNGWHARADGVYPDSLGEYTAFGETVYSPVSGTVVATVDSLADQVPPETHPRSPVGNHVWLRRDSLYVVLAHLRHGSIRVEEGEEVDAGTALARVGNTGNTTEPHLHLHAVTHPGGRAPSPDSLEHGQPVPVTIEGRFLTRNSTFRGGAQTRRETTEE